MTYPLRCYLRVAPVFTLMLFMTGAILGPVGPWIYILLVLLFAQDPEVDNP